MKTQSRKKEKKNDDEAEGSKGEKMQLSKWIKLLKVILRFLRHYLMFEISLHVCLHAYIMILKRFLVNSPGRGHRFAIIKWQTSIS